MLATGPDTRYSRHFPVSAKLILGAAITGVLALSVHVVLQEVIGVPHPNRYPAVDWLPTYINYATTVFAVLCFACFSAKSLHRLTWLSKSLLTFVLLAMLNEVLFRAPLMNGLVSSAWLFALVRNLPALASLLLLACLATMVAPRTVRLWHKLVAALVISGFIQFIFAPFIAKYVDLLTGLVAHPNPTDAIYPPYGWAIMVPAYVTFIEPVAATFVIAALVWPALPSATAKRMAVFALLIVAMRGRLVLPIVAAAFAKDSHAMVALSFAQFSLQFAVLGALTALTRQLCKVPHPGPAAS